MRAGICQHAAPLDHFINTPAGVQQQSRSTPTATRPSWLTLLRTWLSVDQHLRILSSPNGPAI
eukprot:1159527-Pelagomonas_calceolata.AAC.12